MLPQNPAEDARVRYSQSFTSKIFEPELSPRLARSFKPAGKRRDQSTGEMFGDYEDKDLHAMPKTFVPKDDGLSARQKKQNFLSSDVLPHSVYAPNARPGPPQEPRIQDAMMPADSEDGIDPIMRRQQELSSELFGRGTPGVAAEDAHDMSRRLAPNDFKWHSHPESNQSPTGGNFGSHKDRSYHEKCSNVFDHQSPEGRHRQQRQADQVSKREEQEEENLRRADAHYSNLFGRSRGPSQYAPPGESDQRRAKKTGDAADRIVVHQDWTDTKTEIMNGARGGRDQKPAERRAGELHQSRVFDQAEAPEEYTTMSADRNAARSSPVTTDNSGKLQRRPGQTTQDIHQAHLRTSLAPGGFYEGAESTRQWEVVELHISGLPVDATEPGVKRLCNGFDLQIVKVAVETDPVRNLCKGRARITVRYNPDRDTLQNLVQKLEQSRLRVEL